MDDVEGARRRTVRVGAAPGRSGISIGLLGAHQLDLLMSCPCGHFAEVPIEEAVARLGSQRRYDTVHGRCTACGSREVVIRTVRRMTWTEPPVGAEPVG